MTKAPSRPDAPLEVDFGDDAPPARAAHPSDDEIVERAPPVQRYERNGHTPAPTKESPEAERHILSCCFIDAGDTLRLCEQSGITPLSFSDPANATALRHILSIHAKGIPVSTDVLLQELTDAGELERMGGIAFITQISGATATTAQAAYFVGKVREFALLREAKAAALRTIEDVANFTGGIDEFLAEQQARIERIASGYSGPLQERLAKRVFDPAAIIERPNPIYLLGGTTISTPGNLTAFYSQAKTGKSSLLGAMLAATMTNPTSGHDTLGITGPNYAHHAVLHFDTEQSPYDWQQLLKSSLRRVGLVSPPPWLLSYTLTGLGPKECRELIAFAMKDARKRFGGIHSVIIDGLADLVIDPNDAEECFPLITSLQAAAIEYGTAVVLILHMNPNAEANSKGRGHLGSQLERKAESNITMEKDGEEITKVWATKQRGKSITKDRAIAFKWSDEHQMHRTCAAPDSGQKSGRSPKYEFSTFREMMPEHSAKHIPLAELLRKMEQISDIPRNSFRDLMAREFEKGTVDRFIDPARGVCYRLAAPLGGKSSNSGQGSLL